MPNRLLFHALGVPPNRLFLALGVPPNRDESVGGLCAAHHAIMVIDTAFHEARYDKDPPRVFPPAGDRSTATFPRAANAC